MIDTLKGYIKCSDTELTNIKLVLEYCERVSKKKKCIAGKIGNLWIEIRSYWVKISGSIPKYLHGTNIETLTLPDLKGAFDKLYNQTGVNFSRVKITRIDIAFSFAVERPVCEYLELFQHCPRYTKHLYPLEAVQDGLYTGIQFCNKRITLSGYDKAEEQGESYNGWPYVLRCEMQIKNDIRKTVGQSLYVRDLFKPEVVERLLDLYIKRFLSIELVDSVGSVCKEEIQELIKSVKEELFSISSMTFQSREY